VAINIERKGTYNPAHFSLLAGCFGLLAFDGGVSPCPDWEGTWAVGAHVLAALAHIHIPPLRTSDVAGAGSASGGCGTVLSSPVSYSPQYLLCFCNKSFAVSVLVGGASVAIRAFFARSSQRKRVASTVLNSCKCRGKVWP
jgi:hypothetical protein